MPPLDPPTVPTETPRVGAYRVLGELGRGGMGVVLRGWDDTLNRPVAIKLIQGAVSDEARRRFVQEAQAVAAIDHPNVIPVYAAGEHDGLPFVVMPLLVGVPLNDKLTAGGPLPAADVVRIGRQIALGLHAAHERGIVHRDIKPANVFLCEPGEQVRVLDFGLARRVAVTDGAITASGMVMGTPAYMSPEQTRGERAGHSSDLFSLGVLLFEMAAGRRPFVGRSAMDVIAAILNTPAPDVRAFAPAAPPAFAALVSHLLAKEPAGRPANASEVVRRLDDGLGPDPNATRVVQLTRALPVARPLVDPALVKLIPAGPELLAAALRGPHRHLDELERTCREDGGLAASIALVVIDLRRGDPQAAEERLKGLRQTAPNHPALLFLRSVAEVARIGWAKLLLEHVKRIEQRIAQVRESGWPAGFAALAGWPALFAAIVDYRYYRPREMKSPLGRAAKCREAAEQKGLTTADEQTLLAMTGG